MVILAGRVKLVNPVQPRNAHPPISVIPAGRVKLVNPLQPENVSSTIEVIPAGRVKLVNPLQSANALLVDYQYYTLKTVEKWQNRFCVDTKNVRFNVFNFWLHQNHIDMDWMGAFEPTP